MNAADRAMPPIWSTSLANNIQRSQASPGLAGGVGSGRLTAADRNPRTRSWVLPVLVGVVCAAIVRSAT